MEMQFKIQRMQKKRIIKKILNSCFLGGSLKILIQKEKVFQQKPDKITELNHLYFCSFLFVKNFMKNKILFHYS